MNEENDTTKAKREVLARFTPSELDAEAAPAAEVRA